MNVDDDGIYLSGCDLILKLYYARCVDALVIYRLQTALGGRYFNKNPLGLSINETGFHFANDFYGDDMTFKCRLDAIVIKFYWIRKRVFKQFFQLFNRFLCNANSLWLWNLVDPDFYGAQYFFLDFSAELSFYDTRERFAQPPPSITSRTPSLMMWRTIQAVDEINKCTLLRQLRSSTKTTTRRCMRFLLTRLSRWPAAER